MKNKIEIETKWLERLLTHAKWVNDDMESETGYMHSLSALLEHIDSGKILLELNDDDDKGEEEARQVEKYSIKFRKDLKKENKCLECNSIISEGFYCKKHRWGDNEFLPKPNDGEIIQKG